MKTLNYIHPDDMTIMREVGKAKILTSDGEILWTFPCDWTDAQMREALRFANHAYQQGMLVGQRVTRIEIKQALGI